MALKTKNIISTIIKVAILTLIIFGIFYFVSKIFTSDKNTSSKTEVKTENALNFENASMENISLVGAAISTNIGMKYKKNSHILEDNSDISYMGGIVDIDEIMRNDSSFLNNIIDKNLSFLQEYRSFVKMDYNQVLRSSSDKSYAVNNLIKQLEIRFKGAVSNNSNLLKQQDLLKKEYLINKKELNTTKQALEKNYNNVALQELHENIGEYYALKARETKLTTYLVFVGNMIKNYNAINSYNKAVLDTLINNKDVISKDSFVVIPDSGKKVLDDLGLIITEAEYKADKKNNREN